MTTRINLLPWRETARKEQQREYAILAGSSAAGVAILMLLVHAAFSSMIDYQGQRNRYLEQEIRQLESKLTEIKKLETTRQALIDRIEVIQDLQANRPGIVHLFDELVKTLPDGTYLTNLKQNGNALVMDGKAESNTRVSSYMRQIDGSEWMDKAALDVIETKDAGSTRISSFRLNAKQTVPGAEPEEDRPAAKARPPKPRRPY
jgi:type IV pilus assembly protein PilN